MRHRGRGAGRRETTGRSSIELATAIYHSDRTGRRVRLPIDRSLPICQGREPLFR